MDRKSIFIAGLSPAGARRRALEAGLGDGDLETAGWEYGSLLTVPKAASEAVAKAFSPLTVPSDGQKEPNPATGLIEAAAGKGMSIALAESCTGGLAGALITEVAGSSAVFWGSMVTYANDAKERVLGVDTLEAWGAVSEETVQAMNRGVLKLSGADAAISISGIAGPGGGSGEKPVGTVWFAFRAGGTSGTTLRCRFGGDRGQVRRRAAAAALCVLTGMIADPLLDISWIAEYTFS